MSLPEKNRKITELLFWLWSDKLTGTGYSLHAGGVHRLYHFIKFQLITLIQVPLRPHFRGGKAEKVLIYHDCWWSQDLKYEPGELRWQYSH